MSLKALSVWVSPLLVLFLGCNQVLVRFFDNTVQFEGVARGTIMLVSREY